MYNVYLKSILYLNRNMNTTMYNLKRWKTTICLKNLSDKSQITHKLFIKLSDYGMYSITQSERTMGSNKHATVIWYNVNIWQNTIILVTKIYPTKHNGRSLYSSSSASSTTSPSSSSSCASKMHFSPQCLHSQ